MRVLLQSQLGKGETITQELAPHEQCHKGWKISGVYRQFEEQVTSNQDKKWPLFKPLLEAERGTLTWQNRTCPLALGPCKLLGLTQARIIRWALTLFLPWLFHILVQLSPLNPAWPSPSLQLSMLFCSKSTEEYGSLLKECSLRSSKPMMKGAISAPGHQQASDHWFPGTHYHVFTVSLNKCFPLRLGIFLFESRRWNSFRNFSGLKLELWLGSS